MGSNQCWAGRVYSLCVFFMTGAPEGSPKVAQDIVDDVRGKEVCD